MNCYSGKTVLVTGATGLIGGRITDTLMEMGDVHVIALSRSEERLKKGFEKYLSYPNFQIAVQNISDKINSSIGNVDYIFHAASPMEGKIIANTPVDVIMPNLTGTINCLNFLKDQKERSGISGRLILFSSVTVYKNITDKDISVKENETGITDLLESVSAPYSQSKRMSEVIVRAYGKQFGVDSVIARLSTVYGKVKFVPDTAFYEFINKAVNREDIIMNSSGAPRRDNIFIDDAVSGLLLIAEKGLSGEAYNISSNGDGENFAAVDEIAQLIAKISNKESKQSICVKYKETGSKERKPGLMLDNSKLKALGWEVKTTLSEGISRTLKCFMKL